MATGLLPPKKKVLGPAFVSFPPLSIKRFTLDEYHRLIDANILTENDRVELLNGWIVSKMPIDPPHASTLARLSALLHIILGKDWIIRDQSPIHIVSSDSEPEPDIVVAHGPNRKYDQRHPFPEDIVLLVEVSDSSLNTDQVDKLALYAQAKISQYWIVNLVDNQVEVYTNPRGGKSPSYRDSKQFKAGEVIPLVIAGKHVGDIAVDEVLP
jgi:Uma2 family endonuclease